MCIYGMTHVRLYIYIYIYIYIYRQRGQLNRLGSSLRSQLMSMSASCVSTRIYIEDMRTKNVNECVTSERIFLVKTVNSNVMPTLRRFCWYPLCILWLQSS